jgi:hypothetical protein
MKNFIQALQQNGGSIWGRYKSNPDLQLAKGCKNTIFFSAVNADFKGLLEIDGRNIEIVSENCFKINFEEAEIFLSVSGNDHGEFTAGLANIGFLDTIDLDAVLEGLKIHR